MHVVRHCCVNGMVIVGRQQSRRRLEKFIDETGVRLEELKDEFLVRGSKDEKTDVVTAVNHGMHILHFETVKLIDYSS